MVAINDPFMDRDYLMYLLKYDSVHGNLKGTIEKADGGIKVNGDFIRLTHETDPFLINWGAVGSEASLFPTRLTAVTLNSYLVLVSSSSTTPVRNFLGLTDGPSVHSAPSVFALYSTCERENYLTGQSQCV